MAHEELYETMSSFDPAIPWPETTQEDTRDLRVPEYLGLKLKSLRSKKTAKWPLSRIHDLLEAAR